MGEVCKAAAGMDRKTASNIVKYLLDKYEGHYKDAPEGQTFEKLYDQEKMIPIASYQQLYEEVKEELCGLGLQFKK
jgi:hypothetical protein